MKANEMQIGDYVNYRGQIIKVTSLYDKGGSNEVGWSDKESVWVNADNVEPIPLTPKILEKNEIDTVFKTRYKGFYLEYHTEVGMIMLYVYNNGSFQPTGICFKYVHQLQHALRLCGIEKEIEL
jgi:hypothetical protein